LRTRAPGCAQLRGSVPGQPRAPACALGVVENVRTVVLKRAPGQRYTRRVSIRAPKRVMVTRLCLIRARFARALSRRVPAPVGIRWEKLYAHGNTAPACVLPMGNTPAKWVKSGSPKNAENGGVLPTRRKFGALFRFPKFGK
jgi:hypothetical protein